MKKGHTGASLGGTEKSPERKKKEAQRRRRQEEKWAARSGEVKVIKPSS